MATNIRESEMKENNKHST